MGMTLRHKPGSDSIDDSTPKRPEHRGDPWILRWRYWPADGGQAQTVRTQARTKAEVLRKARAKLADLKAAEAEDDEVTGSAWSLADSVGDYIDRVTLPAIANGQNKNGDPLAEGSQRVYRGYVKLLRGECGNKDHDHAETAITAGSGTIGRCLKFRVAERCIQDISTTHGATTADKCRTVLDKYVYGEMRRDGLVDRSPLAGMSIALGKVKAQEKPANEALPATNYYTVLDHLIDMDAKTVEPPKRMQKRLIASFHQRWSTAIDITLLQMTTGMRIGECRTLEPAEVIDNSVGGVNIFIPEAKAKNNEERTVTILDERVADRISKRRNATPPGSYVLGAPADSRKRWDDSNSSKAVAALYRRLAAETGVDVLEIDFRSHGWRGTLNMIHFELPDHIRAAWFGHTTKVNRQNYTRNNVDHSEIVNRHRAGRERHLRAVSG